MKRLEIVAEGMLRNRRWIGYQLPKFQHQFDQLLLEQYVNTVLKRI